MLGQPVYFLTPDVVGLKLTGRLREAAPPPTWCSPSPRCCASQRWSGKFVEFFGEGTPLSLPDRATIANMAPEYGATMGFFPVDERRDYFQGTGRSQRRDRLRGLLQGAGPVRRARRRARSTTCQVIELDLGTVAAQPRRAEAAAGPHRAQDVAARFNRHCSARPAWPTRRTSTSRPTSWRRPRHATSDGLHRKRNGDVLIAAITSCTNTSNPGVLLAAGLLAKRRWKGRPEGQSTSRPRWRPGSRIVTEYLTRPACCPTWRSSASRRGVGYGCTTCIGNPALPEINEAITAERPVCAAVLSGNRNFEGASTPT